MAQAKKARLIPCHPKDLYPFLRRDFHASAIKAPEVFERLYSIGYYHAFKLFIGDEFMGYTCLAGFPGDKMRLMDYFAVNPELRSKGYGKILISELCSMAMQSGYGIICESEDPGFAEDAGDKLIRERRISFYVACGAVKTGVNDAIGNDHYNIMSVCGNSGDDEILAFLRELYSIFFGDEAKVKVKLERV